MPTARPNRRGPYKTGLRRRSELIESAISVFAGAGYTGGSLRQIAARVGVTPAALRRHFGDKEGLLIAVLGRWDADHERTIGKGPGGLGRFEGTLDTIRKHAQAPGLIDMFLTVAAEGTQPGHPAHDYVHSRYDSLVKISIGDLREARDLGTVRAMDDPEVEAAVRGIWALMDGLQLQWLLDPEMDLVEIFGYWLQKTLADWAPGAPGAPGAARSGRSGAPRGRGLDKKPESRLQLALDATDMAKNQQLLSTLQPHLARVEIGTPLLVSAGLGTIAWARSFLPEGGIVVADTKICDAGERIASAAYAAGADIVTLVPAAADSTTWEGVLRAARDAPVADNRHVGVLVDTIGWKVERDQLNEWAAAARREGVGFEVCVHRSRGGGEPFAELIDDVRVKPARARYAVAGKMTAGSVGQALSAGFSTVVVGSAISESDDPAREWAAFLAAVGQPSAKGREP